MLPSYIEWYKAAYLNANDGLYYDFANGRNTAPLAVVSGTQYNTGVLRQPFSQGPADVTQAGGLSPYGVMGLGGNVLEFDENSRDLLNSSSSDSRGIRGGYWAFGSSNLLSTGRGYIDPAFESQLIGFRVARLSPSAPPPAVPEPSMMVIGTFFGIGGLMAKRRIKR